MFYELLQDGTIGYSSNNKKVAEKLNLTHETEEEIIYGCDGKRYLKSQAPTPPEPTYAEKRASEYPALSEQLDMLYWDKINGTTLWQATITQIKDKYPKA